MFQFLIGIINPLQLSWYTVISNLFQFLIGIINPTTFLFDKFATYMFQFLIGIINPLKEKVKTPLNSSFNSS